MNITPDIRMIGANDEWCERKARDIFTATNDRGHPELQVLSASQELGMVPRSSTGIDIQHDRKNEVTYKRVVPGDFVIHLRSFQGGFAHSEHEGITSPAYTIFRPQDPTAHSDYFWKYLFTSADFIKRLESVTYGIRDGRSISYQDFLDMPLVFPSAKEPQHIGEFCIQLDNLIALQKQKLDQLKNLKAGLLARLFPAEGSDTPALRFSGFTKPWVQRTLGDFGRVAMNRRIFKHETTAQGDIPFFKIGTFGKEPDAYISRDLFERYKKRYPYPKLGDILISAAGSIGKTLEYTGEDAYFQDSNIVWLDHNDELDNSFLHAFYEQSPWSTTEGSTIDRLYNSHILQTPIFVPDIAEQKQVGSLTRMMNETLTLHTKKLEKMRDIKGAFLSKMFPSD